MTTDILAAARDAYRAGLNPLPAREDGTKRPDVANWQSYQRRRLTETEFATLFERSPRCGMGIVCGVASGPDGLSLAMLEFESEQVFQEFEDVAHRSGLGPLLQRLKDGYLEQSPGGGYHLPFYCEIVGGNTKLARHVTADGEIKVDIETREQGGWFVCAPSNGRTHLSGGSYQRISGSFATIPVISRQERDDIYAAARSLDDMPKSEPQRPPATSSTANGDRPGDWFNRNTTWEDLLSKHGWKRIYTRNGTTSWRRPGKDVGISATTNHAGSDLLWVFSTSTVFAAERSYDKFGAYAVLEHGGDFRAAAKSLEPELVIGGHRQAGQNGHTAPNGNGSSPPPDPPSEEAATAGGTVAFHLTDLGNAERLIDQHGKDLRYCYEFKRWLVWDGRRWRLDAGDAVRRRAKRTVRSIYHEAAVAEDTKTAAEIAKHAKDSEKAARIEAMLSLAQSERGVRVLPDELDANPWLLCCQNGTLDLRTGELREHRRDDLITKMVNASYRPDAICEQWQTFVRRIMGDEEKERFLQRSTGYSLTGDGSERAVFIGHGTGKNGKTTFYETIETLLADYARHTPVETLMVKRNDAIPNDLAALKGARFVTASESEEGRRLAESFIKQLTGNDVVSARFLYGEFFDFRPICKVWLMTNHKPVIRGTDEAIWDRVKLIPFDVRIPPEEQDKHLRDKLREELDGILTWAVQGCLDWQRDGLREPESVRRATASYRSEMDVVGAFIADRCLLYEGARVAAKDLYTAYTAWCDESGEKPITQQALGRRLTERGLNTVQVGKSRTRTWQGIGLLTDPQQSGF